MLSYPRPKSQKDIRAYLGLCNYYRRFVKGFAEIARPLNRLLGKDVKFEWTEDCEKSFNKLKKSLTESPILVFPNFSERFYLYVDASNQAISYSTGIYRSGSCTVVKNIKSHAIPTLIPR